MSAVLRPMRSPCRPVRSTANECRPIGEVRFRQRVQVRGRVRSLAGQAVGRCPEPRARPGRRHRWHHRGVPRSASRPRHRARHAHGHRGHGRLAGQPARNPEPALRPAPLRDVRSGLCSGSACDICAYRAESQEPGGPCSPCDFSRQHTDLTRRIRSPGPGLGAEALVGCARWPPITSGSALHPRRPPRRSAPRTASWPAGSTRTARAMRAQRSERWPTAGCARSTRRGGRWGSRRAPRRYDETLLTARRPSPARRPRTEPAPDAGRYRPSAEDDDLIDVMGDIGPLQAQVVRGLPWVRAAASCSERSSCSRRMPPRGRARHSPATSATPGHCGQRLPVAVRNGPTPPATGSSRATVPHDVKLVTRVDEGTMCPPGTERRRLSTDGLLDCVEPS